MKNEKYRNYKTFLIMGKSERKAMASESYQGLRTVDPPVGAFVALVDPPVGAFVAPPVGADGILEG